MLIWKESPNLGIQNPEIKYFEITGKRGKKKRGGMFSNIIINEYK